MSEDVASLTVIGSNIRTLRKAKGWTLEDLSRETGEPINTLSRIETAKNEPGLLAAIRIAQALGTSVESLRREKKSRQLAKGVA